MAGEPLPDFRAQLGSAGIFLVLRRMRAPLIALILIFAVSVLGLSLMPGTDADGRPHRLGFFDAFYFMAYTATTIGFGEIPHAFTVEQRLWVTFAIFLSVVGWAYAIGSLLALAQDQPFRRALARRSFARAVRRIGEPFLLLVGYGDATKMLARSLDDMGRRFVVVDRDHDRVSRVELDAYHADVPALVADARDTGSLVLAGLGHANCHRVIALSGDDETNLDVVMTTSLLRPGLPVIARTSSRDVGARMRAFDVEEVVNPLDRFGDHLRILLRSPAAYQLMVWLTSAPGTPLPPRLSPVPRGRWVVGGDGRFGHELTDDLRAEGLEVTVLHVEGGTVRADPHDDDPVRPEDLRGAVAFVAATENDTTNLWLVDAAKDVNPDAFVVALQNRRPNAALFSAVGVDFGMYPAEVAAHEMLARLANPGLMRFLPHVPRQTEEWADRTVRRLVDRGGPGTPDLWEVRLDRAGAPTVTGRLDAGSSVVLADLLRAPTDRTQQLHAVPLALFREGRTVMGPDDSTVLQAGDELLVAGRVRDRAALQMTLTESRVAAYVLDDRHVPSSWLWRRLSRGSTQVR